MSESITTLIEQWNEQRLDLFAISQPAAASGEFHGVIRFYHKEKGFLLVPSLDSSNSNETNKL